VCVMCVSMRSFWVENCWAFVGVCRVWVWALAVYVVVVVLGLVYSGGFNSGFEGEVFLDYVVPTR
jgi:hypothetical protein